jgi:hypothetical protein
MPEFSGFLMMITKKSNVSRRYQAFAGFASRRRKPVIAPLFRRRPPVTFGFFKIAQAESRRHCIDEISIATGWQLYKPIIFITLCD